MEFTIGKRQENVRYRYIRHSTKQIINFPGGCNITVQNIYLHPINKCAEFAKTVVISDLINLF